MKNTCLPSQRNAHISENEMLQMMLDSPYEGIIYVDESGIIKYVNEAFARYTKKSKENIVGHRHAEFAFDNDIDLLLETKDFVPMAFTKIGNRKFIVSRRPVYHSQEYAGVFSQYFSISPQDVEGNFGKDYLDLIAGIQTKDIMFNVAQTVMELHSYKDEFTKTNSARRGLNNIEGNSPVIQELKQRTLMVSQSPSSVLITGESGTGKELFAQAIHYHGDRATQPFVKVNCAAIPESLLESELFGYVDGAFTGARKGGKMGKFELADRGTIFLDEIGDMPRAMQVKLLRVLQDKEIERLGSEETIPIDVRVITATNKNLLSLVQEGAFREELYYRINVINIHIPPLRERKSDIPAIINYTINELNKNLNLNILSMSPEAIALLVRYDWPGNIRELKNVLEATMNFCRGSVIEADALPYSLHINAEASQKKDSNGQELQGTIDQVEKEQLISVLKQCRGRRKDAAEILNVSKSTLYRLMKKHDLL